MVLGFVPLAQPEHMFWGGWDPTYRAAFGLVGITEMEGRLYPCIQVLLLLWLELFPHLTVCVPVQPGQQVVIVLFAGQAVGSLPLGLLSESALDVPPWCLKVKLLCKQQLGFGPAPMKQFLRLPSPFEEVDNGCSQRPTDTVPRVLLLLEAVVCLAPCLFQGLDLVGWLGLDEMVNGFDVLDEDLITWVDVAFGVYVISDIQKSSSVMS